MKDIIIVGAGTYGKEVMWAIQSLNRSADREGKERPYNLLGFIDDNLEALEGTNIQTPIIGRIKDWKPIGNEYYALGAAFPTMKVKLVTLLKERGCRFETVIAPWSRVASDCEIGEGCFVTAVSISAGTKLGDFVNVNGATITPGAYIGDFSTITGFAVVEDACVGRSEERRVGKEG